MTDRGRGEDGPCAWGAIPAPRWLQPGGARAVVVLLVLPWLAYLGTLGNGFVWDDFELVVDNPVLRDPGRVGEILTTPAFQSTHAFYRPVVHLTYMASYLLHGPDPRWFHATNVLIHALNVVLLFRCLRLTFGSAALAFVAAALYSVHPATSEAVNWVSGRVDLLAMTLGLGALHVHLTAPPGWNARRAAAWALYVAALLTKETAAPFLAVMVIADWMRSPHAPTWRGLAASVAAGRLRYGAYAGGIVVYVVARQAVVGPSPYRYLQDSLAVTMMTMAEVHAHYARTLVLPTGLAVDRLFAPVTDPLDPAFLLSCGVVAAPVAAAALLARRGLRIAAWGICWVAIFLVPVSQIIPFATLHADRYLLIPAAGFCILVADLLLRLAQSRALIATLAFSALLVAYGALSRERSRDWLDDFTLFRATERAGPMTARAHDALGVACLRRGEVQDAGTQFAAALALDPLDVAALGNLAVMRVDGGDVDGGIALYQRAATIAPDDARIVLRLGAAYLRKRDFAGALAWYRRATVLMPRSAAAFHDLAVCQFQVGDRSGAVASLRRAIECDPADERHRRALGDALADRAPR